MSHYSVLFRMSDGNFLASSDTPVDILPSGFYRYDRGPYGVSFIPQAIEPSKIVLDIVQANVYQKILSFWEARQKYLDLGITHKRGILLYGPPGTGKTTLLRHAIKEHISSGGIVLSLNNTEEFPDSVNALKDINGRDCRLLVVIEDIEESYEESLSTALDGIGAVDNTLFIATTNFLKRVSKRLSNRPSRFDEKIEMGYPVTTSRFAYIKALSPSLSEDDIGFLTQISDEMSQAHIKELIIQKTIYGMGNEDLKTLAVKFKEQCADWEDEDDD